MFRLHVIPGQGEAFDHVLAEESVILGRASGSDLILPDRFLSRRHARFFRRGEDVFVEDLGSRNGTFVNGRRIEEPTRVSAGDVVKLSATLVSLHEATDSGATWGRDRPAFSDQTVFRQARELLASNESSDSREIVGEEALRRFAERLRILNEVHQALGRSIALEDLLELILDRAFDHLRPEQGAIFLKRPDGQLYVAAQRVVAGPAQEQLYSRSLAREVADRGLAALVLDAQTDERFAAAQSILSSGVRSLVAAPLLDPEGSLGMIVLNSRVHVRQFSEEDLELLVSLASVAALRIRNVALADEAAQRRRLEEEMALARRIQVALLPARLPDLPGYEVHGANIPSRLVSGDYYETIPRFEGRECVLMIADVSGKGMAASLLTACLEALSAGPIEDGLPVDSMCAKLARLLYRRTPPEKFATAFLATLDLASGRLTFTNAGHNPAILVRREGEVERLEAHGVPLGLLPQAEYSSDAVELAPGDLLVLYTDGITEAINAQEEEFGIDRLIEVCRHHRDEPLDEIGHAIEADLESFAAGTPFHDDRTFLLARRFAE